MDEKKKCKTCLGKKVLKEKKSINVELDKGTPHGDKQVLHGEGNELPGLEAGDLLI